MKNRLIVEATQYTYMFYSGLLLVYLAVIPNYNYFVTVFAIPFVFGNIVIDFLSLFLGGITYIVWAVSAILILLLPINWAFTILYQVILIPLELLSPLTLVAGIVLLYLSLSNLSQI